MQPELVKIWKSIHRHWTDPENNEMGLGAMAYYYVLRKAANFSRRKVLIELPLNKVEAMPAPGRIAVILHCFYTDVLDEMIDALEVIPFPYRFYISTDTVEKRDVIAATLQRRGLANYEIRLAINRGRDIAPKYVTFRDVYAQCDFFLHLHGKKSLHLGEAAGGLWRRQLLQSLLGSEEIVRSIFAILGDPRVGLVFPDPFDPTIPTLRWGKNYEVSLALAKRLNLTLTPECPEYPAGSMFWAKAAIVRPILDLNLQFEDFPPEKGQLDGGLNHALERMIVPVAAAQKLYGIRVATEGVGRKHKAIRVETVGQLSDAITTCMKTEHTDSLCMFI